MKKKVLGGNTNLFKTRVKPRKIKTYKRKKKVNGGGIFSFLSNGIKKIIPSSLKQITKSAVVRGSKIAKQQLKKKSVQNALKSAISDVTNKATNHVMQKVSNKLNGYSEMDRIKPLPKRRRKKKIAQ